MISLSATIQKPAFVDACGDLPDDIIEHIVGAYPMYFRSRLQFGGAVSEIPPLPTRAAKKTEPVAPKPARKARAAKEPTLDEQAADRIVLAFMAQHNGCRSSEIKPVGLDTDVKNESVRRLFKAGKLTSNGQRGAGARYYVPNGAGTQAET